MKDFKEVPQTTPESNETVAMAHDKPGTHILTLKMR